MYLKSLSGLAEDFLAESDPALLQESKAASVKI